MQTLACLYFYFEGIKVPFSRNPFWHKKLKCLSTCLRYSPRQSLQVALRNLFNNNLPTSFVVTKNWNTLACQPREQWKRTTNSSVRVASESDVFWIWINNRRILRRLLQHTGDMVTNNDLILSTSVPALGLTLFQRIILINLPITIKLSYNQVHCRNRFESVQ